MSKNAETENDEKKTTIRAKVTPDEHDAVQRVAKRILGITIEELVKCAVDGHLKAVTGKGLAEHAAAIAGQDKYVQGELF